MRPLLTAMVLLTSLARAEVAQKEIDKAIEKGRAYLETTLKPGKAPESYGDTSELVALTLAHAGAVPRDEPLAALLKKIVEQPLSTTYNVALQAVLLMYVDPLKYRRRIADCGQFLVDAQLANGQWTYAGMEVQKPDRVVASGGGEGTFALREQPKGTVPARDAAQGDNSNSQFGILGLWAVGKSGVRVPLEPLQRAERWWKEAMSTDGGWGYEKKDPSYASMTCAGIAAMAITGMAQGEAKKNAAEVTSGLRWLGDHFSVKENVSCPGAIIRGWPFFYYYLYSLERVGTLLGVKEIAGHDWYQEGAAHLLRQQSSDGSWWEKPGTWSGPVGDTCFAILFLKRATASIVTGASIDRASVTPDDPSKEPADEEAGKE